MRARGGLPVPLPVQPDEHIALRQVLLVDLPRRVRPGARRSGGQDRRESSRGAAQRPPGPAEGAHRPDARPAAAGAGRAGGHDRADRHSRGADPVPAGRAAPRQRGPADQPARSRRPADLQRGAPAGPSSSGSKPRSPTTTASSSITAWIYGAAPDGPQLVPAIERVHRRAGRVPRAVTRRPRLRPGRRRARLAGTGRAHRRDPPPGQDLTRPQSHRARAGLPQTRSGRAAPDPAALSVPSPADVHDRPRMFLDSAASFRYSRAFGRPWTRRGIAHATC